MRSAGVLPIALNIVCHCAFAQAPVRYMVALTNPERHLVEVTMEIAGGSDAHELQLPVWNALYQVRDFSQYLNRMRAVDATGRALTITHLNKSRWRISGAQNGAHIEYEMFSDNGGPFGAQLNPHHAFFNLAQILMYAEDHRGDPVQVEFRGLPAAWKVATPLAQQGGGYTARNYDQLVDSPVEIGTFAESDFAAACGKFRVIVDSESAKEMLDKIVPPIRRIVTAATDWMNDCAFDTYMFLYHFSESPSSGGMEHADSTAITLPAKDGRVNLEEFGAITAHEFFHLWDVKRIRPQSLEPIDYTRENYTTALWFSEGVDSTAAEYIRLRAGLLDERHYLDQLGEGITELQNRPAHLSQSAEQSSEDAWLEKYPYYSLPQRSISYYNKGELLGVVLDLAMRDASHDQATLRELFRWMNEHYARERKYFADSGAVRQAAETLSHADLGELFSKYVAGVEEIPWDTFFAPVGLHVVKTDVAFPDTGFGAVRQFDQPPTLGQVYAGTEADRVGLRPGDILLQIDGRAAGRDFEKEIAKLGPGATLRLTIRRAGEQLQFEYKLGSRKQSVFRLEDVPKMTAEQKARRAEWLFDGTPQ